MPHDYLHDLIDRLHDTPMQRKLRQIAPMPIGSVFLPWPGMTEEEARAQFRTMKELGYTCLKQTMPSPEWPVARTLNLALDEGIIPFWYAEGGWEEITPELLEQVGLSKDTPIDEAMEHPAMIAHQTAALRARIERGGLHLAGDSIERERKKGAQDVPSVVGAHNGHELREDLEPHFIEWLEETYGSPRAVAEAWNCEHVGLSLAAAEWTTWEDVRAGFRTQIPPREYRHLRDILRFRADMFIRGTVRKKAGDSLARDPHEPVRAGGEMGLFLPFAARGTDMEGIAREMAEAGSFYPSIHPAWHFEEVDFELPRAVFMQAQLAVDWAKGIWSGPWESTGGPQYFSGGKAPFVEEARSKFPGFTIDEGAMTQLMLSYLAAGFRGFGIWTWNSRTAGWEAGEFALTDRNRQVTPRARRVGEIGRAACRWRRELWASHKEPLAGVLVDWDNEAIWSAMAVTGRDMFRSVPVRARIGASRALINANIPWEYVTTANLRDGLGPRYRTIYVPAFISLSSELQRLLLDYARGGGRVVLDMPGAYFDEYGRVFDTSEGSVFEELFGAVLNDFAFSNPHNTPLTLEGVALDGFAAAITPTRARVVASYEENGWPAITEAAVGEGSAVLLGAQPALNAFRAGNTGAEAMLVRHVLGEMSPPYRCEDALVYRRAGEIADHWFVINDGPARSVRLDPGEHRYTGVTDAVTNESMSLDEIALEARSARWLRAEKNQQT